MVVVVVVVMMWGVLAAGLSHPVAREVMKNHQIDDKKDNGCALENNRRQLCRTSASPCLTNGTGFSSDRDEISLPRLPIIHCDINRMTTTATTKNMQRHATTCNARRRQRRRPQCGDKDEK